jgi:hypothetical protein
VYAALEGLQPGTWDLLNAASHMTPPNNAVHSEFIYSAQ